jgi:hypothetical protein
MSVQSRQTALQNEVVRLDFTFCLNGRLGDPGSQPVVEIIDCDGVTVLDVIMGQKDKTGLWYADWFVPTNLPVGMYYDRWSYQWDSSSGSSETVAEFTVNTFDSYINFISPSSANVISDRVAQLLKDMENYFIYEACHIKNYWEQGMRVQQEFTPKRHKQSYAFSLDGLNYIASEGDLYKNNGQIYTVTTDLSNTLFSSSSSSSMDSSSSSSSSSMDSSSSSSSSSMDSSSTSQSTTSSSSSGEAVTTTTTTFVPQLTLITWGTGDSEASGVLTKVRGEGSDTIGFTSVVKEKSKFSTKYNFAYENWRKDFRPVVRLNDRIVEDGWVVDYNGHIYFDGKMSPEDSVNVHYQFSCFSQEEVLGFLHMGLRMMNSKPPASETYPSLDTMPGIWDAPVLLYAAVMAMRRLVFGLNFQEKRMIFGETAEEAQQAISNFQSLYQEYQSQWDEISKDAKTRQLPGISLSVTPEYTLPGGRSRWFRYLFKTNSG